MATFDMRRTLIERVVSRALKSIENDTGRSVRNLIELGLSRAKGRFQQSFLSVAQDMLSREDSPYYRTARNAVRNVAHDTLLTFGLNLGYNGYTLGARTIRSLEASMGVNIPWIINIEYARHEGAITADEISALVAEGKRLGIYSYALWGQAEALADLRAAIEAHTDCAFLLFTHLGEEGAAALAWAVGYRHALVFLSPEEQGFAAAFQMLRRRGGLVSLWSRYGGADIIDRIDNELGPTAEALESMFIVLVAQEGMREADKQLVQNYVERTRGEQAYPFFLINYASDAMQIDAIISNQPCYFTVASDGQVLTSPDKVRTAENIRNGSLQDIILRVMPPVHPMGYEDELPSHA